MQETGACATAVSKFSSDGPQLGMKIIQQTWQKKNNLITTLDETVLNLPYVFLSRVADQAHSE